MTNFPHPWLCLALFFVACSPAAERRRVEPVPGSFLSVETGDQGKPDEIMTHVQQMLLNDADHARLMLSHGAEPPTGYHLKFKGHCADHPDLVAAVTVEIRRTTAAPVRCDDAGAS